MIHRLSCLKERGCSESVTSAGTLCIKHRDLRTDSAQDYYETVDNSCLSSVQSTVPKSVAQGAFSRLRSTSPHLVCCTRNKGISKNGRQTCTTMLPNLRLVCLRWRLLIGKMSPKTNHINGNLMKNEQNGQSVFDPAKTINIALNSKHMS